MPQTTKTPTCFQCGTNDLTPGRRKCRIHRVLNKNTRSTVRNQVHSTTRRALQDRDSNTTSTRAQAQNNVQSKANIWFGSSAYEPQPTPPSRYQGNEEDGISSTGYQLSSELRTAFHDNAPKKRRTTAAHFQQEARRSPAFNQSRSRNFTVFKDDSTPISSQVSSLLSSQFNQSQQTCRQY